MDSRAARSALFGVIFCVLLARFGAMAANNGGCVLKLEDGTTAVLADDWDFGHTVASRVRDDSQFQGTVIYTFFAENVVSITQGASTQPNVDMEYVSYKLSADQTTLTVQVGPDFAMYESTEPQDSAGRSLNTPVDFICSGGPADMKFKVNVDLTNNHLPEFPAETSDPVLLPMPFPNGYPVSRVQVTDLDLGNVGVTLTLDAEGSALFDVVPDGTVGKVHYFQLKTKKQLALDETLAIVATATDNSQSVQTTSTVTLTFEPDVAISTPPTPRFTSPVYMGELASDVVVGSEIVVTPSIEFSEGYHDTELSVSLVGGYNVDPSFFEVTLEGTVVKLTLKTELPETVYDNAYLMLILEATRTNAANTGSTVIHLDLPPKLITTTVGTTTVPTACPTLTTQPECPTTSATTECPICPTTVAPTECPTTVAPTECPPTVAPTECPTTVAPTECPVTTCPTECPTTVAPTECPVTTCPTECPTTVAPTECPVTTCPTECPTTVAPTECPVTTCPTECPTTTPGTGTTDCPVTTCPTECPTTIAPTECPVTTCPTECPTTTPGTGTTDCPVTTCPTECPTTTATTECPDCPLECPTTTTPGTGTTDCPVTTCPTECPTTTPGTGTTDCPVTTCPTECPTTTPGIGTTDCPVTTCPTECPTTTHTTECPDCPLECPTTTTPGTGTTVCPGTVETTTVCPFDCSQCATTTCPATDCTTAGSTSGSTGGSSVTTDCPTECVTSTAGTTTTGPSEGTISFEQALYSADIEPYTVGIIVTVKATADPVRPVLYSIVSSSAIINSKVTVDGLGNVEADNLPPGNFIFDVAATVAATSLYATTRVSISVSNTVMCGTEVLFAYSVLAAEVTENVGETVLQGMTTANGTNCVYSLIEGEEYFTLDATTGALATREGQIDREGDEFADMATPQIRAQLNVACEDTSSRAGGRHTRDIAFDWSLVESVPNSRSDMVVMAVIQDENDNRPMFLQSNPLVVGYPSESLLEQINLGSLCTVSASDDDAGLNAELKYSLVPDDDPRFYIHPTEGTIYVMASDVTFSDQSVQVQVTDRQGGAGGLTSSAELTVQVKILSLSHVSEMILTGAVLEDVPSVLASMSDFTGLDVRELSASVLPRVVAEPAEDDRRRRDTSARADAEGRESVLKLVVYAVDNDALVTSDDLIKALGEFSTWTIQEKYELQPAPQATDTTGLVAAVITLGVLVILMIIGAGVAVYFFYVRPRMRRDTHLQDLMNEGYEESSNSSVTSDESKDVEDGKAIVNVNSWVNLKNIEGDDPRTFYEVIDSDQSEGRDPTMVVIETQDLVLTQFVMPDDDEAYSGTAGKTSEDDNGTDSESSGDEDERKEKKAKPKRTMERKKSQVTFNESVDCIEIEEL